MPDFILDTLDFLAYMKAIFLLTWKLDTLTVEGAAWYTKNNNWVPPCGIFDSGSRACRAIHIRRRGTPVSSRDTSDLVEINMKLQLLKSIIGVEWTSEREWVSQEFCGCVQSIKFCSPLSMPHMNSARQLTVETCVSHSLFPSFVREGWMFCMCPQFLFFLSFFWNVFLS